MKIAWTEGVFFLGNDICRSCSEEFDAATTADLYAHHIETAIQRIQSEVSNVIINLSKPRDTNTSYKDMEG